MDMNRAFLAMVAVVCLAFALALTGCISTSTHGTYDPVENKLTVDSSTRTFGNTAAKNAKAIKFEITKNDEGFKLTAEGVTNLDAETQMTEIVELMNALKAAMAAWPF